MSISLKKQPDCNNNHQSFLRLNFREGATYCFDIIVCESYVFSAPVLLGQLFYNRISDLGNISYRVDLEWPSLEEDSKKLINDAKTIVDGYNGVFNSSKEI